MTRFRLLSIDPAWRFGDKLTMSKVKRGADAQYRSTMSIAEICALPVRELADDTAILCLWRPSSFAREALTVMDAWGFRQTQELVWVKRRSSGKLHFGMGRVLRSACEVAYIGVRGNYRGALARRNVRNVIESPPLRHSAKPDVIQHTLSEMMPGPALELFARRDLGPPWTCIGNECPSTFGRSLQDVLAEMVSGRLTPSVAPC